MANFSDVMHKADARLDLSRISDDVLLPDGTEQRGRFVRDTVQSQIDTGLAGAGLPMTVIVFETAATSAVLALVEGAILRHADHDYRVLRKLPPGGDHVGRITLELGSA